MPWAGRAVPARPVTVGAQLEELRESIAAVGRDVAALERKTGDRIGSFEANLERIAVAVKRLAIDRDKHPPAIHWPELEARDAMLAGQKWDELEAWIGDVLIMFHPVHRHLRMANCWREHRDAVASVTALWLAWEGAYVDPGAAYSAGAVWLRDFLPACGVQLAAALETCLEAGTHQAAG